jgi:hypothetical protein
VNESRGNREETTYRSAKERKNMAKKERVKDIVRGTQVAFVENH